MDKEDDKPHREPLKPVTSKVRPPSIRREELQHQSSTTSSEAANPKKKLRKDTATPMETESSGSSGSGSSKSGSGSETI